MLKATANQLRFLDDLRESGRVNMFDAAPHLGPKFPELSEQDSVKILAEWMGSFGRRHPQGVE